MNHRAFEQVGNRCQADVRMRAYVVVDFRAFFLRTEVIEEYKGPDALLALRWQ